MKTERAHKLSRQNSISWLNNSQSRQSDYNSNGKTTSINLVNEQQNDKSRNKCLSFSNRKKKLQIFKKVEWILAGFFLGLLWNTILPTVLLTHTLISKNTSWVSALHQGYDCIVEDSLQIHLLDNSNFKDYSQTYQNLLITKLDDEVIKSGTEFQTEFVSIIFPVA